MSKSLKIIAISSLLTASSVFISLPAYADYVQPNIKHADYGTVKMVVPVTSPDPAVWAFKLRNLSNSFAGAKAWHGELKAKVVLYGAGVKMLMEPMDASLKATIDELRSEGVTFAICNNTLKGMNLDWHTLYNAKESDIVPAGFLEVGWLANHGWAVNAMN